MKENSVKSKSDSAFLKNLPDEINLFLELSGELFFQLDLSGNIISINKNGAVLLGYKPEELTGKYFFDLIKPSFRSTALKAIGEINNDKKVQNFETVFSGKSNDEIIFKIRIKRISEGGNVSLIGTGKNISNIKKLEAKISELSEKLKETKRIMQIKKSPAEQKISLLDELNRMKAEFISGISHEFRTPLASIIGFSESILTDHSMTSEHQKEFTKIILAESKRLAHLIHEVLDMTRLEAGGIELEKTKFNCNLLIEKVIEKLNDHIKKKKIILTKELPEEEILVYGDKEKLRQVFFSILENAIKYTGRGGRISLFLNTWNNEFEVIITDTGIGISKKDIQNIFQKYYNDTISEERDSKRGLGLVFVKHIVDLHKGSISIQSEVNEGTTVIVKLLKEE